MSSTLPAEELWLETCCCGFVSHAVLPRGKVTGWRPSVVEIRHGTPTTAGPSRLAGTAGHKGSNTPSYL